MKILLNKKNIGLLNAFKLSTNNIRFFSSISEDKNNKIKNNDVILNDIKKILKNYNKNYKCKYISSLNYKYITNLKFQPYYFSYDIETYKNEDGNAVPYLFGIYSPEIGFKNFYGENCVKNGINFILHSKYSQKKITFYAHNAGNFDAYLIVKNIIEYELINNIDFLMDDDNSLFYMKFNYNNYTFEFKDSFRLMPLSLEKLIKGFNVIVNDYQGKLPFNHSWVNKDNLFYKGSIPNWLLNHEKLLINLNSLNKNIFDFQSYSISYNEIDTVALHKVIEKFYRILVDNFHIDFSNCITLPQLVMQLFRKKFLNNSKKIRLFSKRIHNIISKAYYGPNFSVYTPFGENLYMYDINSLYPSCMLKSMPVGSPKSYNIKNGLDNLFGFALAKIECPKDLKITFLPLYAEIEGNERLIFPSGIFKGYYFSEELKYARELGYKIELIKAWEFEKDENLFRGYIEPLYELKRISNKSESIIFKFCLNTLYGVMGKKRIYRNNLITSDLSIMETIEKNFSNIRQTTLTPKIACYSFDNAPNPELLKDNPELFQILSDNFEKSIELKISNIAISAAITAYARIEIDKFKRIPGINCYYTANDSIVIDKPLPKEFLGDELGKMKNVLAEIDDHYTIDKDSQYYIKKGIFLRENVYSLLPFKGDPIIKFSGLNNAYYPADFYKIIESIYESNGENLVINTEQMVKNPNNFSIQFKEIKKTFTFKYNKRIMIYNDKNIWVDTKPIYISSIKVQNLDLEPLVGRQNRQEKLPKFGLKSFNFPINHYNVSNTSYKNFDGFLLNYVTSLNMPITSTDYRPLADQLFEVEDQLENVINKLLAFLQVLAEKAMDENILIKGIGYLITEEYINKRGQNKLNTIDYLNTFSSLNELLELYKQHLDYIIEGSLDSGDVITIGDDVDENDKGYNIRKLHLRILIPKNLIKDEKLAVQQLKYVKDTDKLIYFSSQFLALPAPQEINNNTSINTSNNFNNNLNENVPIINFGSIKPVNPKKITGAKNNISNINITQINSLINNLKELDIRIEKLNSELKDYKSDSFNYKMVKTQIIIAEQDRAKVLRELLLLGIKDPYNYILIENIINLIYKDSKLLALPSPNYYLIEAPNYKFITGPNYKLLSAPKNIINPNNSENNGYEGKINSQERFNELNDELNLLFNELKAEKKDFDRKEILYINYTKELYEYKIFVVENWNLIKINKNITHFNRINKYGWESELRDIDNLIKMYKTNDYNPKLLEIFLPEMEQYKEILIKIIDKNKSSTIDNNLKEKKK